MRNQELLEFVAAVPPGVVVLVDGAYAEFVTDVEAVLDADLVRAHVVMTRPSPRHTAWPGCGSGTHHPARAGRGDRPHRVPYALASVAEAAAIEALAQPDHMRRNVERVNTERARLAAGLRQLGLDVVAGHGNVVWLPMPEDTEAFVRALARAGVMVKSYPGYGVRTSIGAPEETDRLLSAWPKTATAREVTGTIPTLLPST